MRRGRRGRASPSELTVGRWPGPQKPILAPDLPACRLIFFPVSAPNRRLLPLSCEAAGMCCLQPPCPDQP